ncbi:MAG: hypothetical protein AAFY72_11305 [Cyanobacteria bacterium J06649_4]
MAATDKAGLIKGDRKMRWNDGTHCDDMNALKCHLVLNQPDGS